MKSSFFKLLSCALLLLLLSIIPARSQTVNITPKNVYFGRIPEGKSALREVLIYNIGTKSLNISKLRIEGTDAALFTLAPDPGSVSLGIAQKLVVPVAFKPLMDGTYSARLVVESNASSSPNYADLSGISTDLDKGVITFERILGSPDGNGASVVHELPDGGFIVAGSITRLNQEYSDAALTRTDRYGQIEWRQWYGEEEWSEGFSSVIVSADGGYIAAGSHSHTEQLGQPNIFVVKTDAAGNLVWKKSYGKSDFRADGAADITATADGAYLIAGYTQLQQHKDAYLIKIDANGAILWEKTYGGSGGDDISRIKPAADGGFVFVGSTSSHGGTGGADYDFYLVKVDAAGNLVWEKNYGGSNWDEAHSFIFTADGGYLLAGFTASPEFGAVAREAFLIKLDASGNKEWQKLYGWEHKDAANEVIATDDGGYLFVGSSERHYDLAFTTWRSDLYVVKTDGSGVEQWSKTFGDVQEEGGSFVRQTSDGGFVICGYTSSYSKANDVYLLKLSRNGLFTAIHNPHQEAAPERFALAQNYPNPFNNLTVIRYTLPRPAQVELSIYNLRGQQICTLENEAKPAGTHMVRFTNTTLASGIYYYQLKANSTIITKRMLLLQ